MSEDKQGQMADFTRALTRLQAQGAVDLDGSKIRYQASVVRSRLAKIEEEARLLRVDLELMESLEQGLNQTAAPQTGKAALKKVSSKAHKATETVGTPAAPAAVNSAPLAHREKFPALTPKRRAERSAKVIAAAREFVKANGPELKVRTLADFVAGKGIDMNVPQDRLSTAVGNIMFHAGPEFTRIADGVYRHSGKGVNGHARS